MVLLCGPCQWTGFGRSDKGEESRVSVFERRKCSEKKEERGTKTQEAKFWEKREVTKEKF